MQREGSPSEVLTEARGDSALPVTVSPHPQDYISLFPLDDMQPSKLMRLLSSNEEDANILSSPGECGQGWAAAPSLGTRSPGWAARGPSAGILLAVREGMQEFVPLCLVRLLFPTPRETGVAVEALLPGPGPGAHGCLFPTPYFPPATK